MVAACGSYAQQTDKLPLPTDPDALNDHEFHLPLDAAATARVDALILQLRSPAYPEREGATAELIEIGAPAFARLREAFQSTDDLEVKLRIEQIVTRAYLNRHVFNRFGFLGIRRSARQPSVTHEEDERIPEGCIGIVVEFVIEDTGAARAGVESGDVIVRLHGAPIKGNDDTAWGAFAETIRESGAGAVVPLTVLRKDEVLELEATLGGAPREGVNQVMGLREIYPAARQNLEAWWDKYFRRSPTDFPAARTGP